MTKQERIHQMNTYLEEHKKSREVWFAPYPALLFFALLAEQTWWIWTGLMTVTSIGLVRMLWQEGNVFAQLSVHPKAQRATSGMYHVLVGWYVFIIASVMSYKLMAPWWVWGILVVLGLLLTYVYRRHRIAVHQFDVSQPLRTDLMARGLR